MFTSKPRAERVIPRRVLAERTTGQTIAISRLIPERVDGTGRLRWQSQKWIETAPPALTYPAAISAVRYGGQSYAEYIQSSLRDRVARGRMSHDEAMGATLGELLRGNDGE